MLLQSESNLKFFIFILKEFYPLTPSLTQLKKVALPGYVSPEKVHSYSYSNNYIDTIVTIDISKVLQQ